MKDFRKTEKTNLENKRTIYRQIGMIVSLAVILVAFEWKNYDDREYNLDTVEVINEEEEIVLNTQREQTPPPQQQKVQTTVLDIVEDDVEVDDDVDIDAEDSDDPMEEFVPVEVEEEESGEAEIFQVVEQNPEFPGGDEARLKYLAKNIKYPQMARESGIQGKVYVTFVVEPDGRITNVRLLRGIGGGCDEEAMRVIKSMPRWTPGKQRNKPVRVQFNMPIKFTLAQQ